MLKTDKNWIVYLSTFPPRECGIATFTQDLANAFDGLFSPGIESRVVAMNVNEISRHIYHPKVIYRINQNDPADYERVANELNRLPQIRLVNIQHEFGIHGGIWGRNLLAFLKKIEKPVVTTFHTVLPSPNDNLKDIVTSIANSSFAITVMTGKSKSILVSEYGISKKKIFTIPHGIHPMTLTDSAKAKNNLHLPKKLTLSTFGLLSRDKGIEYVIESLPNVVKKFPDFIYLLVGATHPMILKREGEKYRNQLVKKVFDLGLTQNVRFYNRYLSLPELLQFLQATDIYISTSLNPNQAVSGTLTYGLGTGRPVISTAFAQAKEDVPKSAGILVDFKNPAAYSDAILKLLESPELRRDMSREAYFVTRNMTWPNVAIAYMKIFSKAVPNLSYQEKNLPSVKLNHLNRMTDSFGIFQFANLAEPNVSWGYTADDNARALIVACLHYEKFKSPRDLKLIAVYLNFLQFVSKPDGYFDNYVNYDKTLNTKANTEESHEDASSRALYALSVLANSKTVSYALKEKAKNIFMASLAKGVNFRHLRAVAFYAKSLSLWLDNRYRGRETARLNAALERHCGILNSAFKTNSRGDWKWFEKELTYANAILPDALLSGYLVKRRKNLEWLETAKTSMEFLISKTFIDDTYVPIGQGGWHREGGFRAIYDQQPEEPSAMVQALKSIYLCTKDDKYRKLMYKTFYWFLGDNIAERIMYDATTGGCYDGLGKKYINLNQGAESTVSYLIARLTL